MHRHEAFLADILAHPEDDVARLIYADWLEETGGPAEADRAELIRAQCALARLPADAPGRLSMAGRIDELLAAHDADWVAPLRERVVAWEFARGFVEWVSLTGRQLLDGGQEVFRLAPLLRRLTLLADGRQAAALAESPLLERVTRLEMRGRDLGDAGAAALAASPHLGGLRELILHHCGVQTAGAVALARAPLTALTWLNLGANDVNDEGVAALAAGPHLGGVRLLGLGANNLGTPAVRALVRSRVLTNVEDVNLGANYLDNEAVRLLAASPWLAGLRVLDLRHNEFGPAGARALAESPHLGRLESLDVSANRLDEESKAMLQGRFGARVKL